MTGKYFTSNAIHFHVYAPPLIKSVLPQQIRNSAETLTDIIVDIEGQIQMPKAFLRLKESKSEDILGIIAANITVLSEEWEIPQPENTEDMSMITRITAPAPYLNLINALTNVVVEISFNGVEYLPIIVMDKAIRSSIIFHNVSDKILSFQNIIEKIV